MDKARMPSLTGPINWGDWARWAQTFIDEGKAERAEVMLRMALKGACGCVSCRSLPAQQQGA